MARIGVEETLSDVKNALMEMGHEIIELRTENDAKQCDCCVITGLDNNVMGIETAVIDGPVINADGQSAEEICRQVNQKFS